MKRLLTRQLVCGSLFGVVAAIPALGQTAPPLPSISGTFSPAASSVVHASPAVPETYGIPAAPVVTSGHDQPLGATAYQGTCESCGCRCAHTMCSHCGGQRSGWDAKKAELQASHWGYPEFFCERPFGSQVEQAIQQQIANGVAARQVLFHYDFLPGDAAAQLSPRGRYQLAKIVGRMHLSPRPQIVIQRDLQNPELNHQRLHGVQQALIELGSAEAADLVVISNQLNYGVSGDEARLIYLNQLQQTKSHGAYGSGSRSASFSGNTGMGQSPNRGN